MENCKLIYTSLCLLNEAGEHLSYVGDVVDALCEIFVWVEMADDENLSMEFVVRRTCYVQEFLGLWDGPAAKPLGYI